MSTMEAGNVNGDDEEYPNLLRSEKMSYVQLFIPTEVAHDTVAALGSMEAIHLHDLNPTLNPFQRSFVGEIRRFEDLERIIRFFSAQIEQEKEEIEVTSLEDSSPLLVVGPRAANVVDEIELNLQQQELKLQQMNKSCKTLGMRKKDLWEGIRVLRETAAFFDQPSLREEIRYSLDENSTNAPLLQHQVRDHESAPSGMRETSFDVKFVAGVIDRARVSTFERVLWRLLRGNLYIKYTDIEDAFVDPVTGDESFKNVFIIFVHGEVSQEKINKVADSMGATVYPISSDLATRSSSLRQLTNDMEDIEVVLSNTLSARHELMTDIAKTVKSWEDMIRKEKRIYEALNLFNYDVRRKTLIAEGWVPSRDIPVIRMTLRDVAEDYGSPTRAVLHEILGGPGMPPTFFRTNRFTEAYQAIMDSYGTARYQEINTGLFSIVTFPFLFAVMFGDLGHAIIIILASVWLIRNEKKLLKVKLDDLVAPFFEGRYIILLMGFFSVYTGLMYNDVFSKSLHLFKSGWTFNNGSSVGEANGHVYPFGLDPGWHGAANRLAFLNSYKMKMAIVIGLAHMTFTLCLQIPNHIRFNRRTDIYLVFLPQFLFLQSIIGYLVFCILFKWSVDWSKSPTPPPSLLNMFIAMFLEPIADIDANSPSYLFDGQAIVQRLLLTIAMLSVPVMFAGKPCYMLWQRHRSKRRDGYVTIGRDMDEAEDDEEGALQEVQQDGHGSEHSEEDFSEIWIHQTIHTIEFCLNTISHTASYLRLWALSLAHAQLTEVLWNMCLGEHFPYVVDWGSIFHLGFIWVNGNIGVLCVMEGTSAFLHALRLHWVEGNSKHFEGGGYPFKPLSFKWDGQEKKSSDLPRN